MVKKTKRRIRKSTKYICILISIITLFISVSTLFENLSKENMKTEAKQIYKYTNKFSYDYKVKLLENKYIKEKDTNDKKLVYVTELIDVINLDLHYEYLADKIGDLKYKYDVIGKTKVVYTKDGEEQKILDDEEIILSQEGTANASDKIEINEEINLDLKGKNQLLSQFKQQMGMSVDAKYDVILKLELSTNIDDEPIKNVYASGINMDLAEKTTKITGDNNKEDTQYISKKYNVNTKQNIWIIILDLILTIISILVITYVSKIKTTNRVKNKYREELNRILKLYQDRIVKISAKPKEDVEKKIIIKDFEELVKVSEELFKPILYYMDNENEKAWFSVISSGVMYQFVLENSKEV